MKSSLLKKLETFLAEKRKSTGGWAEVQSVDTQQLRSIIQELIESKFDRDPDGDLPIEVTIVDRTRFEPMHFEPVPYMKDQPIKEKRTIVETHALNLSIAHDRMQLALRILRDEERREER